jgi:hypothetical protein
MPFNFSPISLFHKYLLSCYYVTSRKLILGQSYRQNQPPLSKSYGFLQHKQAPLCGAEVEVRKDKSTQQYLQPTYLRNDGVALSRSENEIPAKFHNAPEHGQESFTVSLYFFLH